MKLISIIAIYTFAYRVLAADQQCLTDGEICGLNTSILLTEECCSGWCYAGTCKPEKTLSRETKKCIDMMRLTPKGSASVCGNSTITIYGKQHCACGAHNEITCPEFQELYAEFKEKQCTRVQSPEYQISSLRDEKDVDRIRTACEKVDGGHAKCPEFLEAFPKFAECEAQKPLLDELCDKCDKCRHE